MASKKKATKSSSAAPGDGMAFEEAMGQLESIVEAMESEKLPLDDLVKNYEEGTKLLKICQNRIDAAQKRIELIAREAGDDEATLSSFEAGEEKEQETPGGDSMETDEIQLL